MRRHKARRANEASQREVLVEELVAACREWVEVQSRAVSDAAELE